ncbi:MAG: PAS domain S-box protein [Limnoraphis robusta]
MSIYQQMRIASTVALVYCGSAQNGEFFGVLRSPEDGSLQLTYSNPSTNDLRQYYGLDVRGQRTYLLSQADKPYDSRQRPWYTAATSAQEYTWTDIYIAFTTKLPNITASVPVYDQLGNNLIGVCATDVVLPEEFRNFLQRLEIGKTGQAFVVDRQGYLISNSTNEPLMSGQGETAQRLKAVDSQDKLVRETAKYLVQNFNGFDQINQAQQLIFKTNRKQQFIDILPFQDGFGLDWLIVVVVPEADFMGQINTNTRNTILFCFVALLFAIVIGILTGKWMTRPLQRVSQASDQLAQGQLNQQVEPSFITEILMLGNSFNSMAKQLKNSFTILERKNEELRIAEENYRSIFENALEGIFQSSPQGRYISVNPALARIYGYDSPAEMMNSITNIGEQLYVNPEQRKKFRELLQKQDTVKGFEYRCYCKDGSIIWTEINARAVKDNSGKVLYYEGIVKDITERKRQEDELRRQLEELKIEIDHKKRAEEVANLTESSYFQEVQQQMSAINLDEFWG